VIGFLGEALIDLVASKEGDKSLFYNYIGGCALNAAVSAARLEADVIYMGKISSDVFGKEIEKYFKENRVDLFDSFVGVKEPTMLAFAHLDTSKAASYTFYTKGTTIDSLSSDEIVNLLKTFDDIHYLHVGSVSLALENSGNEILKALKSLNERPFIFFDPNVREAVINDNASYLKRVLEVAKLANMIKLSDEDIKILFPSLEVEEAIDQLLDLGVEHIVLTMGKEGLKWFSQDGLVVSVKAYGDKVVDTIGAGDTVSGALLSYLSENAIGPTDPLEEEEIKEALTLASKAAAVTVSRAGANPPFANELSF
jgi:fructokinase